jgi:Protein of unknown function (DUF1364)
MNLRKLAKGMECQVRLAGICNNNPETTVLAHYRLAGTCGMGIKPPDLLGAWACSSCHDAIDGRSRDIRLDRFDFRFAHAEGVLRTLYQLTKLGKLK